MIRNCHDFEAWLDDGRPAAGEAAAAAHAAVCERCREALVSAQAVEAALALPTATPAPAGFTNVVMRRVGAAEAQRRHPSLWSGFLLQPATIAYALFVALAAWQWSNALSLASRLGPALVVWADAAAGASAILAIQPPASLRVLASPDAMLGLVAGALPLFLWFSWQLGRWSERAFRRCY